MKKIIFLTLLPISALANSPCDYQHRIVGKYTKEITRIENIEKEVFSDTDSTRKCVVELDAWVDGVKHRTEGSFSFGPDISETSACGHAEQRAKENLIRKISPEVITANTDMICKNHNDTAQQKPPVVVHNTLPPTPQRVYGVIPNRPVYAIHSNRVQFEANPKFVQPHVYVSPPPVIQPYVGR